MASPAAGGSLRASTFARETDRGIVSREEVLKVVLVGGARVGKSSLLRRLLLDCYTAQYLPTLCADVHNVFLSTRQADQLGALAARVELWDVSHIELRGKHLTRFLAGAHGIAFVFDWTDLGSIQAVEAWRRVVDSRLRVSQSSNTRSGSLSGSSSSLSLNSAPSTPSSPFSLHGPSTSRFAHLPCVLIGNKLDAGKAVVSPAELDAYVRKSGFRLWRAVSARSGAHVRDIFEQFFDSITEQIAYARLEERCHRQLSAALSARDPPLPSTPGSPRSARELLIEEEMDAAAEAADAATQAAAALKDVEERGTAFYLSLGGQLGTLVRLLPGARQLDAQRLEEQRASEYDDFRAQCAGAAASAAEFDATPGDELSQHRKRLAAAKRITRWAAQTVASLADKMASWKSAVEQLEMAIALAAPPSTQKSVAAQPAPRPVGGRVRSGSLDSPRPVSVSPPIRTSESPSPADDALAGLLGRYGGIVSSVTGGASLSGSGFGVRNASLQRPT